MSWPTPDADGGIVGQGMPGPIYQNATIRLTEFAHSSDWITNIAFIDCVIDGPAVVKFMEHQLDGKTVFEAASLETLLMELTPGRTLVGVLGIQGCRFLNCRFRRIGVVIAPQERRQWEGWLTPSPDEPGWYRYVETELSADEPQP